MTELKDIKKGDRVKAVNTNGDVAEFTVWAVGNEHLSSYDQLYDYVNGWSFEKITPPLPDVVGYYGFENEIYELTLSGRWFRYTPFNPPTIMSLESMTKLADKLRRYVLEDA